MAVVRINKNQNYTVMSNYHFQEKDMSLKAKGLLSFMLSLPDDWDYSVAGLVACCKENETAIKNALNELQEFGYLKVTKLMPSKDENRARIEYVYDIFERPQEDKKQEVENLPLENQPLENQGQINTKEQNTKELNTKIKNINIANPPSSSKIEPQEVEIVKYLNEKAEKHFRTNTADTKGLIKKLLKAGFTVDDFKSVIDNQVAKWKGNPEWEEYLRPSTLFNSKKFENYLNSKPGGKKQREDTDTSYDLDAYEANYMYI